MKNNNFKVGDVVRIRKGTRYYIGNVNNPKDTDGTIRKIDNTYIYVKWPDYPSNSYLPKDLELAIPKIPKTGNEKYTLSEIETALSTYDKEDIKDIMQTLNNNL